MSKETTAGVTCRCGLDIVFQKEHWQHCPERDKWKVKPPKQREDKSGRR